MSTASKKITCYHLDGKPEEVDVKELKFRPAVYGVLIKDNSVLLSPQFDGYDFPGGGIDLHETIEQALKREVWEETGIKIKPVQVVICKSAFFVGYFSGKPMHSILMYYLCKKVGGELTDKNLVGREKDYVGMPQWVKIKNIDKIKFYNSVDSPALIKQALSILSKNE